MKKKLLTMVLTISTVAALVGCGTKTQTVDESPVAVNPTVETTVDDTTETEIEAEITDVAEVTEDVEITNPNELYTVEYVQSLMDFDKFSMTVPWDNEITNESYTYNADSKLYSFTHSAPTSTVVNYINSSEAVDVVKNNKSDIKSAENFDAKLDIYVVDNTVYSAVTINGITDYMKAPYTSDEDAIILFIMSDAKNIAGVVPYCSSVKYNESEVVDDIVFDKITVNDLAEVRINTETKDVTDITLLSGGIGSHVVINEPVEITLPDEFKDAREVTIDEISRNYDSFIAITCM